MIVFIVEQIAGLIICASFFLTVFFYIRFKESKRAVKRNFSPQLAAALILIVATNLFYAQSLASKLQLNKPLELVPMPQQIYATDNIGILAIRLCEYSSEDSEKYFSTEISKGFLRTQPCKNNYYNFLQKKNPWIDS